MELVFIVFVVVTFGLWDRQSLVREHEVEVSKINDELIWLQDQLRKIEDNLWNSGEGIIGNPGKLSNMDLVNHDPIDNQCREKVKEAVLHAWNSYKKYACGQDELQPISMKGVDTLGGVGAVLVDSFDTLCIMGLKDQFQKAGESLPRSWEAKVIAIQEAKYLNKLSLEELLGFLITHEMRMMNQEENSIGEKRILAFKCSNQEGSSKSEECGADDEDISLIIRTFKNFLKIKKKKR